MRLKGRFILLCMVLGVFVFASSTTYAKTIEVTVEAEEEGEDCGEEDIQRYLDEAELDSENSYKITVPKGTYTLSKSFHIHSNTTLDLSGVTLKRDASFVRGAFFIVGNPRREPGKSSSPDGGYTIGGYRRGQNIHIIGGVLDAAGTGTTLFTFSHVKNITIQGTTFKYLSNKVTNAHMIEFGASKNVKILNCRFIGNQKIGEAVQIESAVKGVSGSDLMGKEDGTKTKNVTVSGCTFSNFQYGIGTNHGCGKDLYTGIVISKNVFQKISKYAICTYNYKKVKISKNVLTKSGNVSFDSRILKLGTKDSYVKSGNKVKK